MKIVNHIILALTVLLLTSGLTTSSIVEATQKKVVFDEGHGQRFLVGRKGLLDLSKLSGLFQNEGFIVETGKTNITNDVLAKTDCLVISGAFIPLTKPEISVIIQFVKQGGKLCVMLHIGAPLAELLGEMNILISNGVVREQEDLIQKKELDFYISRFNSHELMKGIDRFKVYGGCALLNEKKNAEVIAQTSPRAWIDLNRNNKRDNSEVQQSLGLTVAGTLGRGHFVVFGDDAIFQNRFLIGENVMLGENLARWLGSAK